jgi:hypothetical protein
MATDLLHPATNDAPDAPGALVELAAEVRSTRARLARVRVQLVALASLQASQARSRAAHPAGRGRGLAARPLAVVPDTREHAAAPRR